MMFSINGILVCSIQMYIKSYNKESILVIAPHPDDEVYGCGGTIANHTHAKDNVHVLIVTRGDDMFDQLLEEKCRQEALKAHKLLGVSKTYFADLPAIKLDSLPQYKICEILHSYIKDVKPDLLYIPFACDLNKDHQIVHSCSMVAARPIAIDIKVIYCYETLSSTNWNSPGIMNAFTPNVFVDISKTIDLKIQAIKTYKSQLRQYPHERSEESVMVLSRYRGGFVNLNHAEAFMCIREIKKYQK